MRSQNLSSFLLWVIAVALSVFGFCYIYSTGYNGDSQTATNYKWLQQLLWLVLGGTTGVCLAFWDKTKFSWRAFCRLGYFISLIMLLVVLLWGKPIGGAKRWLSLGASSLAIQPAEFARLFTILNLCRVFANAKNSSSGKLACSVASYLLPTFILIFLEPSAGIACSMLPVTALLALLHYGNPRLAKTIIRTASILVICAIAALFWCRSQNVQFAWLNRETSPLLVVFRPYHLQRIADFLSPRGNWNEQQALFTVASGGALGQGFLNGKMKNLGYLPRTVAPTDFIFAVIAEEGGFFKGVLPVLCLYAALFSIIIHRAIHATLESDRFFCAAYASLLFIHVVIAISMAVRLLPIMGLPLPLISYGGSFTMATMMALGVISGTGLHKSSTNAANQIRLRIPYLFKLTLNFDNK